MKINWSYIQENYDWLGHIVEMIAIAIVMTIVFFPLTLITGSVPMAVSMGISFAIGHFHGREKRDYEIHNSLKPPHLEAYKFWKWDHDGKTDFFPVLIVGIIILILLSI